MDIPARKLFIVAKGVTISLTTAIIMAPMAILSVVSLSTGTGLVVVGIAALVAIMVLVYGTGLENGSIFAIVSAYAGVLSVFLAQIQEGAFWQDIAMRNTTKLDM
jgi:hypothetical protein